MDTGSEEKIRQRAYEIWQREGRPNGREQHHWSQAEAEIAQEESAGSGNGQSQPSATLLAGADEKEAPRDTRGRGRKRKTEGAAPKRPATTRSRNK